MTFGLSVMTFGCSVVTRWAGGGRMHRSLTSGRGVSAASGLGVTMRSGGRTWRHFGGMAGRSR